MRGTDYPADVQQEQEIMITLQPFQPKEDRPYTDRAVVYHGCSRIGMIARLGDKWIVSMHPNDPPFDSYADAIYYLVSHAKGPTSA